METKKIIKIWRDDYPMNPWTDWDCAPPLMYEGGRNVSPKDYSDGDIRDFIEKKVCENFADEKEELCRITGVDLEWHEDSDDDDILDSVSNSITTNDMEMLVELCELLNLPHKSYTSRGYSQGDWLDVLIVLTDNYFEETGCKQENSDSILESSAKLFDNYMWGDVYGFTIEECKEYVRVPAEDFEVGNLENVEREEEWVEVDSCGGFFGDDWLENGMLDHAGKEFEEQLKNYDYNKIEYR